MAIKRMSYLQIPPERRREGATPVRQRLQERLADVTLTPGQREAAGRQLAHLAAWEAGTLGSTRTDQAPAANTPPRTPLNHSVGVFETVKVKDG